MSALIPERLTWSEWRAMVEKCLPTELDIANAEQFAEMQIRAAVGDLQNLIPRYRSGHEFAYHYWDFVTEGNAQRAALPPSGKLGEIYVFRQAESSVAGEAGEFRRSPTTLYDWKNRHDLTNGLVAVNDGHARVAIDPEGETFYLYPAISDGDLVSVGWSGVKLDFEDDEVVPFDEAMAVCVAEYVSAKVALKVDNDAGAHQLYLGNYRAMRRMLYLNAKDTRDLG